MRSAINASRPVSRVLYGRGSRPDVTAIPLGRPSPGASSNQPERQGQRIKALQRPKAPRVAPIRFCSRRGLPCRGRCRPRGALLPHPFTLAFSLNGLAAGGDPAVCFLWRFPWGRPRRTLSGAVSVWSPDFPPPSKRRPSGRLADEGIRALSVVGQALSHASGGNWAGLMRSGGRGTGPGPRSLKLHANYGSVPRVGRWAARAAAPWLESVGGQKARL
jgi:hypothetical protein